jgi:DNA-binding HxlR family transcriptional regulator
MREKTYEDVRAECPVYKTLNIMGKRWSFDVIAELICNGDKRRYNQILKSLVFVTPKVLSQRLKELEENGLIKRKVYSNETPVRVEYELTEKGSGLKSIINEMMKWGNKWTSGEPHQDNCKLCRNLRREYGIR